MIMRRIFFAALAFSLVAIAQVAQAGDIGSRRVLFMQHKKASSGFRGLGDVKTTNWYAAYGTRAFSAATRGSKLINACDSTGGVDVSCADMLSDVSTGDIVPKVIGGITCPSANCTVKIYYDISGATNCTAGPVACDLSSLTVASRATLTANAIGTKTCGVSTGAAVYSQNGTAAATQAQPFSTTTVAKYSTTTGAQLFAGAGGSGGIGFGLISGAFAFYASSTVSGATADTSAHAFQMVANSASSFVVTDAATGTTQNSGGQSIISAAGNLFLFSDPFSQRLNGTLCEHAFSATAFSGPDTSNFHTNQSGYYGTP